MRSDLCVTTFVAPTDAANPPVIKTPEGHTDARRESQYLAFGADVLTTYESAKLLMSCRHELST